MTAPVIVVHGGAGGLNDELREREAEYRHAIEAALTRGAEALQTGGAVEAVCAAVMEMESFPLFNAGYGAALCSDGSVELSASVMRGSDRAAGAVALMTRTRHPVAAAAALLDDSEVLLAGDSAEVHAAANGLEQLNPGDFVTERQQRRLAQRLQDGGQTVGAVCLDETGLLAAATSTGGLQGQRPGRVGDSPLIGAGTWADGYVAVSCTGKGESFVRAGAARLVAALVEHGMTLEEAARAALTTVAECDGDGGLIAVDRSGNVSTLRSTDAMPCGVWRPGHKSDTTVP
ncbi:MAG TPA: isoaspartyl peptidase/L-asparaginase [Solirubrobacteraceae bacterium]|nr:isoaspartyl peptidase/L-asparaginase [Solirubrobacteraceae bacterium]